MITLLTMPNCGLMCNFFPPLSFFVLSKFSTISLSDFYNKGKYFKIQFESVVFESCEHRRKFGAVGGKGVLGRGVTYTKTKGELELGEEGEVCMTLALKDISSRKNEMRPGPQL